MTTKKFKKYFVLFLSIFVILSLLLIGNTELYNDRVGLNEKEISTNSQSSLGYKNILIWNEADRTETANFGVGHDPFVENECEVSDCAIFTRATSMLPYEEYDAVIIHMLFLKLFQFRIPNQQQGKDHEDG